MDKKKAKKLKPGAEFDSDVGFLQYPRNVQLLMVQEFLNDLDKVNEQADIERGQLLVTTNPLDLQTNPAVEQVVEMVEEKDKYDRLLFYLKNFCKSDKVVVFVNSKKQSDELTATLRVEKRKISDENDREIGALVSSGETWHGVEFKEGRADVLVSHGVDVQTLVSEKVNGIINFEMPDNIRDYVNRVNFQAKNKMDASLVVSFISQKHHLKYVSVMLRDMAVDCSILFPLYSTSSGALGSPDLPLLCSTL